MTKYQISVALLSGLGFVSLVCLLMNLPVLNILLLLVVSPGATALRMLPGSLSDSIPKILVANVLIYSLIVLVVIFLRFRDIQVARRRQIAIGMILPVTVTSCLAFFTSFNPLLPRGNSHPSDEGKSPAGPRRQDGREHGLSMKNTVRLILPLVEKPSMQIKFL